MTARPSKIVCIGRNYRAHAAEMGNEVPTEPLIFLKPPSSLIADGEPIRLPSLSEQVEYEGEIAVVMGARASHVTERDAEGMVRGIAAFNDVTARDLQRRDSQWTRAKGFDTFAPVGAEFARAADWGALTVITRVNGVERQRARADLMVFAIPKLIAFISSIMTLEPGDLIATGTPAGVGRLTAGDTVEVEIQGPDTRTLSRVGNPVVAGE
ncbi:MAG: fumarylacetoacetate hydrolase family protein [Gemmatimonadales bacterium]|jgi:2-keto-4-pentenoate hydratase/2-oxohepta-3-ene-1,7-dioic acid hydratase in catechol pathway